MSIRLDGQTAIVTGAGRGLGRAHALALAARGARVLVNDLAGADGDAASAEQVAAEIREAGGEALANGASVADWEQVQAMAAQAMDAWGRIDILVNNAGIADPAPLEQWDAARLQRTLDVNLIGVFNGIQAVVPAMKRAGGGSIVNIGSVGALQGVPRMSGYVVSKWGVRGLTKVAAIELGPEIRVNSVHPGPIETDMLPAGDRSRFARLPLARTGKVEEVAELVLFLASHASSYITGAEITVDAGLIAGT